MFKFSLRHSLLRRPGNTYQIKYSCHFISNKAVISFQLFSALKKSPSSIKRHSAFRKLILSKDILLLLLLQIFCNKYRFKIINIKKFANIKFMMPEKVAIFVGKRLSKY